MKACIIYGLAEGFWHGRKLRLALLKAGYSITNLPKEADIIIAHSGGCFLIPGQVKASVILMIGLPNRPEKHPLRSTKEKLKAESKSLWWFQKMVFNVYYLLSQPLHWFKMDRAWKAGNISIGQAEVILLRNEFDPYMHLDDGIALAQKRGWIFKSMPGQHDDLWVNPRPYVEVIQKLLSDLSSVPRHKRET